MASVNAEQIPSRSRKTKKKSGKKGKKTFLIRYILILLSLFILAGGGYAAYLYFYKFDSMIDTIGTPEEVPVEMSAKNKPLTLLLLGTDARKETGSLNTDVIMVASLNPETKSAAIVSIPRDTLLTPQGKKSGTKANAYYARFVNKNKETADQEIKQFFGDYLDVKIDYMVVVNFKAFSQIIDNLGGITIDVDQDMCYVDNADKTKIKLDKGVQKLNGDKALDFVRYRKSNHNKVCNTPDSGDLVRNERQQRVIAEMVGKLKSINGVLNIGNIFDSLGNNIHTDIPSMQIKDFMWTYAGIDKANINHVPLQGEWQSPYIYVNEDELKRGQDALKRELDGSALKSGAETGATNGDG